MGWQSYVFPYDTDAQLDALLDMCKLHNSSPSHTNVFLRYRDGGQFKQIRTREVLEHPMMATIKKPYKRSRNGPSLSKVFLIGNGGGAISTHGFFMYHCNRLFPHECDDTSGGMLILPYALHSCMSKKFTNIHEIPEERISDDHVDDPPYAVRPALLVTKYDPQELVRLGEMTNAEAAAGGHFFNTVEDGYVVDDRRFAESAEAERYCAELNRSSERLEDIEVDQIMAPDAVSVEPEL